MHGRNQACYETFAKGKISASAIENDKSSRTKTCNSPNRRGAWLWLPPRRGGAAVCISPMAVTRKKARPREQPP